MRANATTLALAAFAAFAVLTVLLPEAEATHYRWGVLSWEPTGEPNEVKFTGNHGWRRSAFGDPNPGDIVNTGFIDTGDGGYLDLDVRVTTISTANDWFIGKFVDESGNEGIPYTYSAANNNGQPWVAWYESCCRISPYSSGNYHVNNPDHSQRLETLVDVSTGNSAPKTILPPINQCPVEAVCTIRVPVTDNEGDALSFRLATTYEAEGTTGFTQPGQPHAPQSAAIDPTTGVITWDTRGAAYDANYHTLYSMAIMVDDGQTKTPLDFFIELLPPGVAPPYWVSPPTPCDRTLTTGHGSPVQFDVRAKSDDAARSVSVNHLGLPDGATMPLPAPANPASGTFSWTPTPGQVGSHLVVFIAEDDLGYQAPICTVTIIVLPGNFDANGFGATLVADDLLITRTPFAHVRDPSGWAYAVQDLPVGRVTGMAFDFDGHAAFVASRFDGHAVATSVAGVIDIPGVLYAEGVSMRAESVVDATGAESWSDLKFAKLVVGGTVVEVGDVSGPREFRIPGVAKVRVHEEIDTGDGRHNANMTAHAFHVVFERPSPVRELYLVGATANAGLDVVTQSGATGPALNPASDPTEPDCVDIVQRLRADRVAVDPIVIAGDAELLAITGGTLTLKDLEIRVPQGGQGIVVQGTTLPLAIRNVRFVGEQIDRAPDNGEPSAMTARASALPDDAAARLLANGIDLDGFVVPPMRAQADDRLGDGGKTMPWAGLVLVDAAEVVVTDSLFEGMDAGIAVMGGALPQVACDLFSGQAVAGIAVAFADGQAADALTVTGNHFRSNGTRASHGVAFLAPPGASPIAIAENRFSQLGGDALWIGHGQGIPWHGATLAFTGNLLEGTGGGVSIGPFVVDGRLGVSGNVARGIGWALVGIYGGLQESTLAIGGNAIADSGAGALDLQGFVEGATIDVSGNAASGSAWSFVGVYSQLWSTRFVGTGNAVVGGGWSAFDFWSPPQGGEIALSHNIGALNAWGMFEFWGGMQGTALRITGNAVPDSGYGAVDVWSTVHDADIRISANQMSDLTSGYGSSGIAFTGALYETTLVIEGNAIAAQSTAGVALDGGAYGGSVDIRANAFTLNPIGLRVAGVGSAEGNVGGVAAPVRIAGNTFASNEHGLQAHGAFGTGTFVASDNVFASNTFGAYLGYAFDGALEGNAFTANLYGILATSTGEALVRDNSFLRSTYFGVYSESYGASLDARENWWGSHDGPSGAGLGAGDAVSSNVLFDPWHATAAQAVVGRVIP